MRIFLIALLAAISYAQTELTQADVITNRLRTSSDGESPISLISIDGYEENASPQFDPEVFEYSLTVPNSTEVIAFSVENDDARYWIQIFPDACCDMSAYEQTYWDFSVVYGSPDINLDVGKNVFFLRQETHTTIVYKFSVTREPGSVYYYCYNQVCGCPGQWDSNGWCGQYTDGVLNAKSGLSCDNCLEDEDDRNICESSGGIYCDLDLNMRCSYSVDCYESFFCTYERNGVDGVCVNCLSLSSWCYDLKYPLAGQEDCWRKCDFTSSLNTANTQILPPSTIQHGSLFTLYNNICNLLASLCANKETQCMDSYCRDFDNSCYQQAKPYGTPCQSEATDLYGRLRTLQGICIEGQCILGASVTLCESQLDYSIAKFNDCGNQDYRHTVAFPGPGKHCTSVSQTCMTFGPQNSFVQCRTRQIGVTAGIRSSWEIQYEDQYGNCVIGENDRCVINQAGAYTYMGMLIHWSGSTTAEDGSATTLMRISMTTIAMIPFLHCHDGNCEGEVDCHMFGNEPCGRAIMACDNTPSPTAGYPSMPPSASIPTTHPNHKPSTPPSFDPSSNPTTSTPSMIPSSIPSREPTDFPSTNPSDIPSFQPSIYPTSFPTQNPSQKPSKYPTSLPTVIPSNSPTFFPSCSPTVIPSGIPNTLPSQVPSQNPTNCPTTTPTIHPTRLPSSKPSNLPSTNPTGYPSINPSHMPSSYPTASPTLLPSKNPTFFPSLLPTIKPSKDPTNSPSTMPSHLPSEIPSTIPTKLPTYHPSSNPSNAPSSFPSPVPTFSPSVLPTLLPTKAPSIIPTSGPSYQPTILPSKAPSIIPTPGPSYQPTILPSGAPSLVPSITPTGFPSLNPIFLPNDFPSNNPTLTPSTTPTLIPSLTQTNTPSLTSSLTVIPSTFQTLIPTTCPSYQPIPLPISSPSLIPTHTPSVYPSLIPTANPSVYTSKVLSCTSLSSFKLLDMPVFRDPQMFYTNYQSLHKTD